MGDFFSNSGGYIYLIKPNTRNLIDIRETALAKPWYHEVAAFVDNEDEFAFVHEVAKEDVVGIFKKDITRPGKVTDYLKNEDFRGDPTEFQQEIDTIMSNYGPLS